TADAQGKGRWVPADRSAWPGELSYVLDAGETLAPEHKGAPVTADRVRVFAEADSGWVWDEFQDRDLWLVAEDAAKKRRYKAAQVETFTQPLAPAGKAVKLRERLLEVRNETKVPAVVQGMVLTRLPGDRPTWLNSLRTLVKPGETVTLKRADGFSLRGSRAKVVGQDQ